MRGTIQRIDKFIGLDFVTKSPLTTSIEGLKFQIVKIFRLMCIVVEESLEKDYLVPVCLQAVSKYRK